jgi:hypothetical protein
LYVANDVGVEENCRAMEGVVWIFGLGIEIWGRTDGIRNLRRIETAIVGCGRREEFEASSSRSSEISARVSCARD